MQSCRVALSLLLAVMGSTAALSAERGQPRAVIELFTSQGCSSCPPADKLLGELADDSTLVVMSLPIDYWDYLGWKDTLAKPRHTGRQRSYAQSRGDREVYTPQVVVNGVLHALGSDKGAIERAIIDTWHKTATLQVPVTASVAGDRLNVTVAAAPDERPSGEIWLCALTKRVPVVIGRGENRGKTIAYHNVIRRWTKLGEWSGAARTWSMPLSEVGTDGVDAVAIIVQAGTADAPGRMLGASVLAIH
jgi:hypothetical protein